MANEIFSKLIDFMEDEDFTYEILEGKSILRFHFVLKSGRIICRADVNEENHWLLFYSYLPISIPENKRAKAGEYLHRANAGLQIGNFEMDYNDGEVRFKTSIDIEGGELNHKMIDNLLSANLTTVDHYFHGLMKIIYSSATPKSIVEKIEQSVFNPFNEEDYYEDFDKDSEEEDSEEEDSEEEDSDSEYSESSYGDDDDLKDDRLSSGLDEFDGISDEDSEIDEEEEEKPFVEKRKKAEDQSNPPSDLPQ